MKWYYRVLVGIIVLAGIGLAGYPLLSNYLYEKNQKDLVAYYEKRAEEMTPAERNSLWDQCEAYNQELLVGGMQIEDPFTDGDEDAEDSLYDQLLSYDDRGAMGSLEVPGLLGPLVIYHGTSEDVLQKGSGHLKGSSLPVGGKGTHAVLTGHTGLTNNKLFTNLDRLEIGDVFFLSVLGEKLAYQVDQIKVILPNEATENLRFDPEKDYVTLITCTPYGINSHRLLVRGTRIPYEEAEQISAGSRKKGSTWTSQFIKSILVGLAIVTALWIIIRLVRLIIKLIKSIKKRKEEKRCAKQQT